MIDTDIDFSRSHYHPCAYSYKHNRETLPYRFLFLYECAIYLILGRKCFRDAQYLFCHRQMQNICLPVSSPIAQTSKSTHAELAITFTLKRLTVRKFVSMSSRSLASCCRDCSSVWPERNKPLTNSCTSLVNGAGRSC